MIVSPSLVTGLPGRDSITATRLCRGILSRAAADHEPRDRTRHNSALGIIPEFAAPHDEQVPAGVDVAKAQPARLPGAQSQPVTQGEDAAVDQASLRGPRAVG